MCYLHKKMLNQNIVGMAIDAFNLGKKVIILLKTKAVRYIGINVTSQSGKDAAMNAL